jgi:hypothetical protein
VAELLPESTTQSTAESKKTHELPGEVVAFAKWNLHREDWPLEGDHIQSVTREMLGEGVDLEVWDAFIGGLYRLRHKHIRGPHLSKCAALPIDLVCTNCECSAFSSHVLSKIPTSWGRFSTDAMGTRPCCSRMLSYLIRGHAIGIRSLLKTWI